VLALQFGASGGGNSNAARGIGLQRGRCAICNAEICPPKATQTSYGGADAGNFDRRGAKFHPTHLAKTQRTGGGAVGRQLRLKMRRASPIGEWSSFFPHFDCPPRPPLVDRHHAASSHHFFDQIGAPPCRTLPLATFSRCCVVPLGKSRGCIATTLYARCSVICRCHGH
jgi:hypothetical protein